jgi:hypothetical protein
VAKLLWTVREHRDLPTDTWERFREKATTAGYSPSAALTGLIRRYLTHGFDDGEGERRDQQNQ